ncbi:hypothetical protein KEM52_001151 [Ascosphaera acerosa]|nr:hypothetical protein KEM52_001151 [Ascosphaera acerosa]
MGTSSRRLVRHASTRAHKAEGDISSVFTSLQADYKPQPLAPRFADLKEAIFAQNGDALTRSYKILLESLRHEASELAARGPAVRNRVLLHLIGGGISQQTLADIKSRGTVVVRGVIPRSEAADLKQEAEEYVAANRERVKAFPADSPAVYEIYWSPAQVKARSHPRLLQAQQQLQAFWHSSDPTAAISTRHATTYADRFRIRKPGDGKFALGPHADGGSLERWEDREYSSVYADIMRGNWETYDAWDARHRITAQMDLYNGAGACSMLRFFQGWLAMSDTGPGEGTLRVCPIVQQSTAYTLLRPFFEPEHNRVDLSASFPGAVPGMAQEYNHLTHPHLQLGKSMVNVPRVEPGDYVAWHCDVIHAVDSQHNGNNDSSVMYIPVAPLCDMNADYLKAQREAALTLSPPPDFPSAGGPGEAGFRGAVRWDAVSKDGLQAMGMGTQGWNVTDNMTEGERQAVERANAKLFAK